MKWFRLYNELLDDPKVQQLSPELFKFWINILCIASKNEGKLPTLSAIAYHIRASDLATQRLLNALLEARLIQEFSNQHSTWLAPHAWQKRQYKSDTSSERVKRFRNTKRNNVVTPPDTDTDTDTDTESKGSHSKDNFDWKKVGEEVGLSGGVLDKCYQKFKAYYTKEPPKGWAKAWELWALNERKPTSEAGECRILTDDEKLISKLGHLNWRRQRDERLMAGDASFLQKYEDKNGFVTWKNLGEWESKITMQ